tara:strand:- start:185 stop:418 length:234 start_codon:yes stop_codon:yes gene_type:complete
MKLYSLYYNNKYFIEELTMKTYLQGILTGGSLVFAITVLTGSNSNYTNNDVIRKLGEIELDIESIKYQVKYIKNNCI